MPQTTRRCEEQEEKDPLDNTGKDLLATKNEKPKTPSALLVACLNILSLLTGVATLVLAGLCVANIGQVDPFDANSSVSYGLAWGSLGMLVAYLALTTVWIAMKDRRADILGVPANLSIRERVWQKLRKKRQQRKELQKTEAEDGLPAPVFEVDSQTEMNKGNPILSEFVASMVLLALIVCMAVVTIGFPANADLEDLLHAVILRFT